MSTIQVNTKLLPLKFPNGKELPYTNPLVMAVVNITPDSFYDGGKFATTEDAIKQAEKLIAEGADILDLGAASTRPGAEFLTPEQELERLLPVLDHIVKEHPDAVISVDTFQSEVAKEAVKHGASIVNDISGGTLDDRMFDVVAKLKVPYILMHIQGDPQTMQVNPQYDDVVAEVYEFLARQSDKARDAGIKQIVVDPGFGFGKTVEHNFTLLRNLKQFCILGPVMAGLSRKSMINKVLKTKPENALAGTISLNTIALLQGANILRVHDVKEARQVILLMNEYLKARS
ncbi:MAG TPA: dihydropteroate synthase [Bacteroidia bacterium]|jgi:dihydropteroate synthase|nr:dihydropteroate synthase [Bacteroidia bacterium]